MQYTICGYQQSEVLKLVDTVERKGRNGVKQETIRIDATDLVILRWFADFYPSTKKMIIDGKEYGWVKTSYILEELPFLDISTRSVLSRMKKLVHFGLLEYVNVKEKGNWSYYRFGASYSRLVREQDHEQSNDQPYTIDCTTLCNQPTKPLCNQLTHKDSSTSNPSTSTKRERGFTPPVRDEVADYIEEMGYTDVDPDHFIAYHEANGWKVCGGKSPMRDWRATVRNWHYRNSGNTTKPTKPQQTRDPNDGAYVDNSMNAKLQAWLEDGRKRSKEMLDGTYWTAQNN